LSIGNWDLQTMWIKYLITILLFYFFALLQSSFFIYFNVFGAVPNLIFVLYFTVIFFDKKNNYYSAIFYAMLAGLFLDIFSTYKIGLSIVLLVIIGILIKKVQSSLSETKDDYSFAHFAILFFASFLIYHLSLKACLYFLNPNFIALTLNFKFLAELMYSLFFGAVGFYICKNLLKLDKNNKQNKFF